MSITARPSESEKKLAPAEISADSSESGRDPTHLSTTVIEARGGWRLVDWKELYDYSDLFQFLVWRSIKVRYAQSALGIGWAVIQPLFTMVVFTIIFGRLAHMKSDGVPYAVFSFTALVPWTYFANSLTEGTASLINNASMLSKVYFPRLILPLAAVMAKLVDFSIALVMLAALLVWYQIVPTRGLVMLPLLVLLMVVAAAGLSLWLTALAVQYRDVNYAMTFLVQLLMYSTPVLYPVSLVPERYHLLYAINPMVGVIEGFRAAFLGTRPMPFDLLSVGTVTASVVAITGIFYFRRREKIFADVV